ncbi:MAG: hypothetical protein IKT40_12235 [Bacilli bacterium]|nr:hypothetical protein [Bacilli bacterium]
MIKEEIIKLAKESHEIEYDYSLVEDCKLSDNITIICPKHGIFKPRLSRFLKGSNCPYCVNKATSNIETFISRSNKKHNNFYSYDEFIYINAHTKGIITCPIHGNFEMSPTNHLNGCGCPKCKTEKLKEKFSSNTEEFIRKAKLIHGEDKYDYSKVEYINRSTEVIIICPKHGEFLQTPASHLTHRGCPICCQSHLENKIEMLLTENNIKFERQKKFDWLGRLSLDFYIPSLNIGIECQGIQHFKHNEFYKNYEEIIKRDFIKNKLCFDNNIKLIYYTEHDTNNLEIYNDQNTFNSFDQLIKFLLE